MAPIFPSLGDTEGIYQQILFFTIYIYVNEKVKAGLVKSVRERVYFTNAMKSMNPQTYPITLENVTELFLDEPIDDEDRHDFMSEFQNPFMSTNKSVKQLYKLNPAVMTPVLDALIKSKRIQRLVSERQGNFLDQLKRDFESHRFYGIQAKEIQQQFLDEIRRLKAKYLQTYEEQEAVIASEWVEAMEKEPQYIAKEQEYSNAIQQSKKGGKRYLTRKIKRKQKRKTKQYRNVRRHL